MMTKHTYVGDGWEFEILKDDANNEENLYMACKKKDTAVQRWELKELADFIYETIGEKK